jgi:Skp family chaperone for outer membrane proteins
MRTFRLFVVSAIFTTIFALSAIAQAQVGATGKVGIIDPRFFEDEKAGITKLVGAVNTVEAEFKTRGAELKAMQDKMAAIQKEGQSMQKAYEAAPNGPIGPAQIQAKAEELEKMNVEFKRKQEDAGAAYSRRLQVVTAPIYADIQKALAEFTKKNNISVLLDARPFGQTQENQDGISIFIYVDKNANITDEFIAFCNTSFVGLATTKTAAAPK